MTNIEAHIKTCLMLLVLFIMFISCYLFPLIAVKVFLGFVFLFCFWGDLFSHLYLHKWYNSYD